MHAIRQALPTSRTQSLLKALSTLANNSTLHFRIQLRNLTSTVAARACPRFHWYLLWHVPGFTRVPRMRGYVVWMMMPQFPGRLIVESTRYKHTHETLVITHTALGPPNSLTSTAFVITYCLIASTMSYTRDTHLHFQIAATATVNNGHQSYNN